MWSSFFLASAALLLLLIIPGFALARILRLDVFDALLFAPLLAIAFLELVAIVFSLMGVFVTGALLVVASALFSLCCFCVCKLLKRCGLKHGPNRIVRCDNRGFLVRVVVFFCVALFLGTWIYVIPLDGPYSFAQDSDNSFHLSLVESFVNSGDYSALSVTLYHDIDASSIVSVAGGYYPAAWHLLAAFVASTFHQNAAFASNVVNYVILLYVFPSGVLLFMQTVFQRKSGIILSAAFVMFAFEGFPWGTLISVSGPLFPNTLGFSLVLPCSVAFILAMEKISNRRSPFLELVCFFIGLFSLSVSHPSSVFTMAVLLAPYLVYFTAAYFARRDEPLSKPLRVASYAVPIVLVFLVWIICYYAPPLKSVTSFTWAPTGSFLQSILNVITLKYRFPDTNYLLSILVLMGLFRLVVCSKYRWLVFSYLLAALVFVVGSSSNGFLQHLFAGFWYTDPYRTAASACLLAIPLAAVGLNYCYEGLRGLFGKRLTETSSHRFALGLSLLVVSTLYIYTIELPDGKVVYTGLGDYNICSVRSNSFNRPNLFDEEEKEFCNQVSRLVDSDAVIYNNADDGSPFAYPLFDLNLLYRRSAAELIGSETRDGRVLRLGLNELSTNEDVKSILEENNVKYILNLDYGGIPTDERCYYGYYVWSKWPGINSIDDETPGLKILLSEGDMRLYEIAVD